MELIKDFSLISFVAGTGTISFSFKPNNSYISGSENLVQRIVKRLLTAKNSNAFDGEIGTNFFHLFGVMSEQDIEKAKNIFPMIIQDLVSQIISEQVQDISNGIIYKDEELLSNINVLSVEYDEIYSGWIIPLSIITKSGDEIKITVG
jgi:hypothetical protein